MDIDKLIKKYRTRDPVEIAKLMGIIVIYERLGSINGYYNTAFRQKFIHINSDIPKHNQIFTAAHELGHVLLHPKSNTPFLQNSTFFSVNKLEIEANRFAINLLIGESELNEYIKNEYTIEQIANVYGYPKELIELRLNINK